MISYSTVLIEQVDLNRNLLAEREFAALSEGGSERAALYDEHEWLWNMDQVARDISLSRRRHSPLSRPYLAHISPMSRPYLAALQAWTPLFDDARFALRAVYAICLLGMGKVKRALVSGQYHAASSLFYGGSSLAPSHALLLPLLQREVWGV